jgi:ribose 5-phosphate isomerase RpiB
MRIAVAADERVGVAEAVVEGRADQAVVCCWTGTGASIAANKVPGIRSALCGDADDDRANVAHLDEIG